MPLSIEATRSVTLVEVSPRDELQNQKCLFSTKDKLGLIDDRVAS
jgi:isopropylmalate/homocitrate/citramalate synthase